MIDHDNEAVWTFLNHWAPEGPWVLTAIRLDKKAIKTATFCPDKRPALDLWLEEFNGVQNLYFHVNPTMEPMTKKASKTDIKSLDWLHVDVDPRAGEDLAEEQERILKRFTTNLPKGVPKPTCVIFSGGGYQGFWKLEEPIHIGGDITKAEDADAYNRQMEILFDGDECHNVDRIMRLPGSINIPDGRKRKKGRVPALAATVEFNDNTYPIESFLASQKKQDPEDSSFVGGGLSFAVHLSGNIARIEDAEELDEWGVDKNHQIMMAQGYDEDNPKKGDNSRSAWLYDFVCHCVSKGVPDEVLYSILTDPQWGISESVVDKGSGMQRYAIKQIESAKMREIDPQLEYFNDKYAVIKNYGGKCLVVSDVFDWALDRDLLTRQTFENFSKGYQNKTVQIGTDKLGNAKFTPAGKWWVNHADRRQYDSIAFAPEIILPETVYNLWKGFAVYANPEGGDCSLFLAHILDNVCGGNEIYYNYLIGWMARTIQQPADPGETAIVLRGGRGVGKSFFAKTFGKLFGRHYMHISNSGHLVGNFNSHLRDLVVLFADEAFYAGDKKHESILKTLVTESQMAIEAKGIDVEMAPSCIHLIMASNDLHVIPAGGDERRFFVVDVGDEHKQDTAYFKKIVVQMEGTKDKNSNYKNQGYCALLHFLKTYDLTNYNVHMVPNTLALREQKLLSLSTVEEWWYQKLMSGTTLRNGDGWKTELPIQYLVDDYISEVKRFNVSNRGSATAMGRFLNRVCPGIKTSSRVADVELEEGHWSRSVTRRTRYYSLPTLEKARAFWENSYGTTEWEDIEE